MARAKKEAALTPEERLQAALVPDWEWPYRLPENWCWANLVALSDIKTGKKDANYGCEGGAYYFFTCASEPLRCDGYSFEGKSILLAGNGDISNISIYDGKFEAYQRTYVVSIHSPFITEYIYHYFKYRWVDYNKDKMFGTAIPYIRLGNLQEFSIPLAPLAEQQRIVDRIESLFAKLDEAKEKAQTVLDSFETRRAAILHNAFTGELTANWREEHGVGMESWTEKKYNQLGESKLGKMLDKAKNKGEPTPYLRNVNVRWFDFDLSDILMMPVTKSELVDLSVKKGDLLICEGGEPGRCAIWQSSDSNLIFQKALHRFRSNKNVCSDFVGFYIYYLSLNGNLKNYFTGSTIKHLTAKALSDIRFNVPLYDEQAEIVRILDDLFAKEQQAKEAAEAVLEKIDLMKKAILARAFRGELGTNDPNDESAMNLLKKNIL